MSSKLKYIAALGLLVSFVILSSARASYYVGFKCGYGAGMRGDGWGLEALLMSTTGLVGGFPYALTSSDLAISNSNDGPITGKIFDTYSDLQNYVDTGGPWTLSITGDAGTSVYSLSPDFSGISQDMLVSALPIVPQQGQVIDSLKPTFVWPDVEYAYGTLNAAGQFANISPQTGNSYTSKSSLIPGQTYFFYLNMFGYSTSDLPGTITLVSGPDLGLLPMSFEYKFGSATSFSVVPEPNVLCLLLAAAPLALRRRRSR